MKKKKKKRKKLAFSSINQSQKQCVPREYLNNWTFRRHHWDNFWIKTLVWCHTKWFWFRSWSRWTIKYVFALLNRPAIDLQKLPILAKENHLFRWSSFWCWRVCIQAKLSYLEHWKSARIHRKVDALKTSHWNEMKLNEMSKEWSLHSMAIFIGPCWTNFYSQKLMRRTLLTFFVHNWRGGHWHHLVLRGWSSLPHSRSYTCWPKISHCLVRILIQRHNRAIFLRKWARRCRYNQWRSLSDNVERVFVHKNWREGFWQHLVSTGRRYVSHSWSYTRRFAPCFWRYHYQP